MGRSSKRQDAEDFVAGFGKDDKEHIKLVCVGDRSVGKTSLILTYGTKKFPENQPPTVLEGYQGVINHGGK
jgi:GTPase SAR1 family protein